MGMDKSSEAVVLRQAMIAAGAVDISCPHCASQTPVYPNWCKTCTERGGRKICSFSDCLSCGEAIYVYNGIEIAPPDGTSPI